ncbi:mucin-2 [Zeugodacus cucurbitae]|nr:mucin-2 [Zeugodacus cucurbitae]
MILVSLLVAYIFSIVAVLSQSQSDGCLYNLPMPTKPDLEDCVGYFALYDGEYVQQYCPPGAKYSDALSCCITGRCPPCNCQTTTTISSDLTTSGNDCSSIQTVSTTSATTGTTSDKTSDFTDNTTDETASSAIAESSTELPKPTSTSSNPTEYSTDTPPDSDETTNFSTETTDVTIVSEGTTDSITDADSTSTSGEVSGETPVSEGTSTTNPTSDSPETSSNVKDTTVSIDSTTNSDSNTTKEASTTLRTTEETTNTDSTSAASSTMETTTVSIDSTTNSDSTITKEPTTTLRTTEATTNTDSTSAASSNSDSTTTKEPATTSRTTEATTSTDSTPASSSSTEGTTGFTTKTTLITSTITDSTPAASSSTYKTTTTSTAPPSCANLKTGTFLPDPDDCNRYYVCSYGQAIPMRCPPTLCFDVKLNVCNYPENVLSDGKGFPTNTDSLEIPDSAATTKETSTTLKTTLITSAITDSTSAVSSSTYKTTTSKAPPSCANLKTGTFLPDSADCNRYYVCSYGQAIPMRCPSTLWFDVKLNVCNYPQNVTCDANQECLFVSTLWLQNMDNNIKKMTLIILLWLSLSLRITSADIFEECENVPKETFVKSLQSCQMYIYCDDNDSYSAECDEGQYFDGDACDDAENVYCPLDESGEADPGNPVESEEPEYPEEPEETVAPVTSKPIITTTTTQSPQTTTKNEIITSTLEPIAIAPVVRDHCPTVEDPNTIVFTANTQSCTSYYLCYHGQAIDMRCTDNLHFNIHTAKCDFPEKVQCMIDRPNANKCLPHVTDFFPHPQKCNYFYYCIKGFLTVQQCPFYYGWDIERRSCVLLDQAKCFVGSKRT